MLPPTRAAQARETAPAPPDCLLLDRLARPLRALRLSVTDRCNLRCAYCVPGGPSAWLPRRDLLSMEEIDALVGLFTGLGVERLRLTGGEPLLFSSLSALVARLAGRDGIRDLAMTTNGVALVEHAHALRAAGLGRVTVSLDTLRRDRFKALTRRDAWERVIQGIDAARSAGFRDLKLDSVIIRGVNDDELPDLLDYGRGIGAEVRFIEYMDVCGATAWTPQRLFPRSEMLRMLQRRHGRIEPLIESRWAPAERFRLSDGTVFGIIASTSLPFCRRCDRSRLTADGIWYLCLFDEAGINLRHALRAGVGLRRLQGIVRDAWQQRRICGAEDRIAGRCSALTSGAASTQAIDPHRSMRTRGG